ncbi:MAG: response regulator [Chloroflexi bacterium]|nr:MAG: response regulator [Chloroflexota bacterium]
MAKIVFCEDEKLLQKLICRILRSMSHEVYVASNGLAGLVLIEHEHPDLILTDISMPGCDGFQLADAVKAQPHLASIPIVFVTAFAQRYDVEEGARHGAAGYLVKPFSAAELRAMIETALIPHGECDVGGKDESTLYTEKP